MEIKPEILELVKSTRDSSFNKENYSVSQELHRFMDGMLLHTWYDAKDSNDMPGVVKFTDYEWLQRATPEFQRENNKWTKKMKQHFIESLLKGAKTELLLFRLDRYGDAQIIDGLQRTTAIIDFLNGKIKAFGYTAKEMGSGLKAFRTSLTIRIYTFDTWEEVGRFYIDMNENITHSKKDILKAKDWFRESKGIEL